MMTSILKLEFRIAIVIPVIVIFNTIIAAFNVYILIFPGGDFSFRSFLSMYWLSWAVGLIFPGQVGDVATLSSVLRRYDVKVSRSLGRSLVDKLISFLLMLIFSLCGLVGLKEWSPFCEGIYFWGTFFLIIIITSQYKFIIRSLFNWSPKLAEFLGNLLIEFTVTIKNYPFRVAVNVLLTFVKITLVGGCYWYVFRALGYSNFGFWQVVPLVALSSIIAYLPISFNGLGTVEVMGVYIFSTIGIEKSGVLSGYLILRAVVLILAWLPVWFWSFFDRKSHY